MRELGAQSDEFHAALADPMIAARVDFAVLVGPEMKVLADALGKTIELVHVADAVAARDALAGQIGPGDAVLVKGSNAIGLASLVEQLASGKIPCLN